MAIAAREEKNGKEKGNNRDITPDTTPNTRPEPKRRERDECEIISNTATQQHNSNTKECDIITNQHTHNKPIQNTSKENKETSKDRKNKNITRTARDNQGKQQEAKPTEKETEKEKGAKEKESEEKKKEAAADVSESFKEAMLIFSNKQLSKIKAACKILRRTEIGSEQLTEACQVVGIWLAEDLTTKDIVAIVRPFFNAWLSKGQLAGLDFILLSFFKFFTKRRYFC